MLNSKIIWSVNVLDASELQEHALFLLGAMTRPTGVEVIPVFVMDAARALSIGDVNFVEAFKALAEKKMSELVHNCDVASMSKGKILENPSGSTRAHVQSLIDFAVKEKAEAIVASTHARKGVPRFFMGSFAETLILNSKIPVITLNPQTQVRERISKILFPTTFDPESRPAFEQAVEMATILEAKLTLFYKEPLLLSPFVDPEVYAYIEADAKLRSRDAAEWKDWAIKAGVPTEIHLDNQPGYVAPAIESYASEKNMDLIVMATQANALSSVVLGSSTRQVIRQSPCPVWVLRVDS